MLAISNLAFVNLEVWSMRIQAFLLVMGVDGIFHHVQ